MDIFAFDMITDITVDPLQFSSNFKILSIHSGIVLAVKTRQGFHMIHATRWSSEIREVKILYCVLKSSSQGTDSCLCWAILYDDIHRQTAKYQLHCQQRTNKMFRIASCKFLHSCY